MDAQSGGDDPYTYVKDMLTLPTQLVSQIDGVLPHRWQLDADKLLSLDLTNHVLRRRLTQAINAAIEELTALVCIPRKGSSSRTSCAALCRWG
jgi:hypothetical protein